MSALGGVEWRDDYRRRHPQAAAWITSERPDHTEEICRLLQPTLLLWGDADEISPVAVGERLQSLLPDARLEVVRGGGHGLAADLPDIVAPLVLTHLESSERA